MLYAQELIEEIRLQNDIVDVVSEYVSLRQKGNSYFGLCPFHNEKTPSFSVSIEKQFYYCFGCGAAGNVYSFVMQMENYDFVEAVKKLADRVHITLPEPEYSAKAKEQEQQKQTLFEIHKQTGRFYYDKLHEQVGIQALNYLNQRQIIPAVQKKFGIGYAPAGHQILLDYLKGKGFQISDMVKSGLIMENKTGDGYHDRFYNRLMFPIFDVAGRVIGFGGRIIAKGEPKYLNSPETILFNKSKTLYGLNFAKSAKKREFILVEGYMDMITVYQAGFHNVVAALGTAFNIEHARSLKKFADDVILLYDSDEAGTNAALRAIPILVNNGFRVKVLQVPDGKDPDAYIKKYGVQEFRKLLINAVSYISFQISCIQKKYNLQNTEQKILFTTEAADALSKLSNDIERDVYTKEVAKLTGVEEEAIYSEIQKLKEKEALKNTNQFNKKVSYSYKNDSKSINLKSKGILEAQRDILYICATDKAMCLKIKAVLASEEYTEEVYCNLSKLIYQFSEKEEPLFPAELISYFESVEEQKMVTEVFAVRLIYENDRDLEKALNEELKLIKRAKMDALAATATNIGEIQKLLELKRKLEGLYITISDG